MKRAIALDVGEARIGVAASDALRTFASGMEHLDARSSWRGALRAIIDDHDADTIVIGMPFRTDGSVGPEVVKMREVAADIAERYPDVSVVEWDERYTTRIATGALIEGDVSRSGRKKKVDSLAAAVLLQSWLDAQRSRSVADADMLLPEASSKKRYMRDDAYEG